MVTVQSSVPSGTVSPESVRRRAPVYVYAGLIVILSLLFALPLLIHGPLPNAHDGAEHENFIRHFSEQFWTGNLYPRWLLNMNHGLGSPSYFVYPPLPAYVCVAFEPLCRVLHLNAFNVAAWFSLLCSGLAAYLWLRTYAKAGIAFICSATYMLLPYHFAIDLYRRSALSECWAFVWMPLLLFFTSRMVSRRRYAEVGFALAFALLIFSHLISVAMFFYIPVLLAVVEAGRGRRMSSALRICGAMALGSAISAVYLFPALANAKYVPVARLMLNNRGYSLSNQLAFLGRGLIRYYPVENFLQTISQAVAGALLIAVVAGAIAFFRRRDDARRHVVFWLVVSCVAAILMCKPSAPIWQDLPVLHDAIQYPWRLNAVLCVGATALLALCLDAIRFEKLAWKAYVIAGLLLITGTSLLVFRKVLKFYSQADQAGSAQPVNEHDGWFPAWVTPGTDQRASLIVSEGPQEFVLEGDGLVQAATWEPRRVEFDSKMPAGGWVGVRQFYYPTWQARANGMNLPVRPRLPEGVLEVEVPAGAQHIEVSIPQSSAELAGKWLSAIAIVFCFPLALIKPKGSR